MNKKIPQIICCILILCFSATVVGCSLSRYTPSAAKVEEIARIGINPDVKSNGSAKVREESGQGNYVYYPMVDDRGIEFSMVVASEYVSIVEPINGLYSKYHTYKTNYREKVKKYYREDIEKILIDAGAVECDFQDSFHGEIMVLFKEGTELADIADAIMQINNLLNLRYCYGGSTDGDVGDEYGHWDDFLSFDILVKIEDSTKAEGKSHMLGTFIFSDGYDHVLTYEDVMNELEE